ncbi:MAG: carboxyl transferase [Lachnospiraceae bacterium]|nr:carboxyl transferase [Lachnospiraceae bacterium]
MADNKAMERIEKLLDAGSFVELGALVTSRVTDFSLQDQAEPSDGVITGYGQIEGSPVYVYSQNRDVLNGTIGEMHAKKITDLYDKAMRTGAPVIGLIDCGGFRLQESVDALDAFSKVLERQILCSGELLMISAVFGTCAGGMTLVPALSDFTFLTKDAQMFVNAPHTVTDNTSMARDPAPAVYQNEVAGLAEMLDTEDEVIEKIRSLILMFENDMYGSSSPSDLNRFIDADRIAEHTDTRTLLRECADNGEFLEICPACHPEMVTGFMRLNGILVGVAGNAPALFDDTGEIEKELPKGLTAGGCEKASRLITFCSQADIPVLTVAAADGFARVEDTEKNLPAALADMMRALARLPKARVGLIIGDTYGSAYLAMNARPLWNGTSMILAWDQVKVGMMEAEKAANILFAKDADKERRESDFESKQNSVLSAAAHGNIDLVIDPKETRKHLIMAFSML